MTLLQHYKNPKQFRVSEIIKEFEDYLIYNNRFHSEVEKIRYRFFHDVFKWNNSINSNKYN